MGFRENLKSELSYKGMLVKELSAKTGINRYTLDNYLSTHNCTPSVDVAVKIAAALDVSVEYLVTGNDIHRKMTLASLSPALRSLIQAVEELTEKDQKIVLKNAINLAEDLKGRKTSH
jgi:transcriptional regulator with XRE-family HTH domain